MFAGSALDIDQLPPQSEMKPLPLKGIPVATAPIRHAGSDDKIVFELSFIGMEPKDFLVTPGGGAPIIAALRRRGLDPSDYYATPWEIY